MTLFLLDKKQRLHQIVEHLSEKNLDKMIAYLENLATTKTQENEGEFEKFLVFTNEKYKKVWEALA